jgi:hypothetical protein
LNDPAVRSAGFYIGFFVVFGMVAYKTTEWFFERVLYSNYNEDPEESASGKAAYRLYKTE